MIKIFFDTTNLDDCKSWKDKTFFVMNQFLNKRARLDEIKASIKKIAGNNKFLKEKVSDQDLVSWERNLLKIFSKHDTIFDTSYSKSIFYL